MTPYRFALLTFVAGVLLLVATVACAFGAIWTVDPDLSARLASTAWLCGFVGVIAFVGGSFALDVTKGERR